MATNPSIPTDLLIPSDETIAQIMSAEPVPAEVPAVDPTAKKPVQSVTVTPSPFPTSMDGIEDASSLVEKTVLMKVTFGRIGNSRKVSGSEVLETDADKALLKVSKQLLTSPELEAIKSGDGKMRTYLYNTCLPFDMGIMLLPNGLINDVRQRLMEYKEERQQMVDNFIAAYPGLCAQAAQHLGSLYNADDYPTVEEIKVKFDFSWRFLSLGVPGHLKAISESLFAEETAKAQKQIQAATEEITNLMRQDLLDLVSHLEDRLTPTEEGKPRILRETAVSNLQDFLKTFDMRNVTNDQELAKLVQQARELVDGTTAATLRTSDQWREKIRSGMEAIKTSLSDMVTEGPGRKFRDE